MYLSIIIPSHNSLTFIENIITSIYTSKGIEKVKKEVIIVDDASNDGTPQFINNFLKKRFKSLNLKVIELKKNQGPAKARNIGVNRATGEIILFLDADVILEIGTLKRVIELFRKDPDLYALTGVWDKHQNSSSFFPKFKALRDWSYWINERDPKNYYYLFSTRVAAIRRDLFLRLGGFDTTYKAALIEDIELTYRITKRHAVVFDPDVKVHHEFENFLTVAKKYFYRSYYWSKIYRQRKKFDPVATTGKEALATVSGALTGLLVILSIMGLLFQFSIQNTVYSIQYTNFVKYIVLATYLILVLHFLTVRKFIVFCIKEEGWIFGLRAFVTGIILYCVITAGAVWSIFV